MDNANAKKPRGETGPGGSENSVTAANEILFQT